MRALLKKFFLKSRPEPEVNLAEQARLHAEVERLVAEVQKQYPPGLSWETHEKDRFGREIGFRYSIDSEIPGLIHISPLEA